MLREGIVKLNSRISIVSYSMCCCSVLCVSCLCVSFIYYRFLFICSLGLLQGRGRAKRGPIPVHLGFSYSISLMSARLQDIRKHLNKIIKADLKTIRCFMDIYFSSASSVRGVGAFRFTAESGLASF